MSGINLTGHHALSSSIDVDGICSPLKDIGITYFNYIKVYNDDGSRELLTNNALWIDHFYNNSLFQSTGAVDIEHLLPKGYFLWSEMDCSDPIYSQGRESFNIDNGVSFVEKFPEFTMLYIFASERNNHKINNFYVRNCDLFKRFMYYFNDKAKSLRQEASKNRIYLPERQEIITDRLNTINISQKQKNLFFDETSVSKYFLFGDRADLYLTKKQAECAAYMAIGATSKECAKELDLSFRTVEEHLADIKTKIFEATGEKVSKKEMVTFLRGKGIEDVVFSEKINLSRFRKQGI